MFLLAPLSTRLLSRDCGNVMGMTANLLAAAIVMSGLTGRRQPPRAGRGLALVGQVPPRSGRLHAGVGRPHMHKQSSFYNPYSKEHLPDCNTNMPPQNQPYNSGDFRVAT